MSEIRRGFGSLPHQIEYGAITEDSFRLYDIVVPMNLGAIEQARRSSGNQKCAMPIPSAESVSLCDDKWELNQTLVDAGFGQYIPQIANGEPLVPPYILKKRVGAWGKDCYIIRTYQDEASRGNLISDPAFFCQEVIPGSSEFATHILFVRQKIVKALNIKYEFQCETPIKGQTNETLRVVEHCPYLELFSRMLRTIDFEGLCCINYKVANGEPYLLEINPRFGGSLAFFFFSFVRHIH